MNAVPWLDDAARVEQAAIACARSYAVANGLDPDDRRAVGLVLAGMAIAAGADSLVQTCLRIEYVRQHPTAVSALAGWTDTLNRALGR